MADLEYGSTLRSPAHRSSQSLKSPSAQSPFITERFNLKEGEEKPWRMQLGEILEAKWFHIGVLILVALDFTFVMTELVIELFEDKCLTTEGSDEESHESIILELLMWGSVTVLSLFVVELFLRLIAFGFQYYIKHPLHTLDAVVIITSLALMIYLHGQKAEEVVSLLIIFRFWRFIRIMDAVMITATTAYEEKIQALEAELEQKQDLILKLQKHQN